ncbi:unannotated protein [freshwater metagenome]|uniref:Unannotated protein n=1 Tax=freshwater metagenome TaxID=449393 RepID=A0A6J7DL80_9ZZZZ|nr:glycosyltransferase [Actinomycetota bacterium]MSW26694.1 glycosyltransferase [Actinomycetota bacterium]MSW34447.1 glycosyltransferase [Actinomycetota bacterium]MSX31405.1 glycosyltransferase [Actinomycetota bacterium]MSX51213.1 glycosyltransferase [Actinomycetota bacterium]
MKALVIIPTYNEADSILEIVNQLLSSTYNFDVLVVDDASPDGTAKIAKSVQSLRIHVIERSEKNGLGSAYRAGFTWALQRPIFTHIISMDGDGSHQVKDLAPMISLADEGFDVVMGTRWMSGGGIQNWPLHRQLISRVGTFYAQKALSMPFKDLTGGLRLYSAAILRQLRIEAILSEGYCFQIEMIRAINQTNAKIAQSPIVFIERTTGNSKMSRAIVHEALRQVTIWGLQRRFTPNADKLHYVK